MPTKDEVIEAMKAIADHDVERLMLEHPSLRNASPEAVADVYIAGTLAGLDAGLLALAPASE